MSGERRRVTSPGGPHRGSWCPIVWQSLTTPPLMLVARLARAASDAELIGGPLAADRRAPGRLGASVLVAFQPPRRSLPILLTQLDQLLSPY